MKFVFRLCILIGATSAMLCVSSCKKDKSPAPTTPAQDTPPAGGYKGLFDTQLLYSISGTATYSFSYGSTNDAYITTNYFTNTTNATGEIVSAGVVSLNNITLKIAQGFYTDSTGNFQPSPHVWKTTGGVIPAFTFTNTNVYPSFTGFTAWPDTIVKSQNLTLNLNGLSGADQVRLYIFSNTNSANSQITGASPAPAASISWVSSSLNALSTGTTATIQMEVYKNNIQTVNGELLNFRTTSVYLKTVSVKN
ncbi:MAG: hypothetical protein ACXVPD_03885 [Bacteroidia bacterium]